LKQSGGKEEASRVGESWQEADLLHRIRKNMIALKKEMTSGEISGKLEETSKSPKAKFEVFGEEMIEKEVKQSGNSGRVYLPPDWVGKLVKIIRID
jgi:putative transposon-encoded protein